MLEKDLMNSIENPDNQLAVDAQAGDIDAEEALIRKYSHLVTRKTKAYFMAGADDNDVMQEGMIGLLKAVRCFDIQRNVSFAAFAEKCITNQIIGAIRSADRIKHKALNSSMSLSERMARGSYMSMENGGENMTLEEAVLSDTTYEPEEMLIIKDVAYYILNNGDNVFSEFEMQVMNEVIKGYSYRQIAERLGKPVKSIDNALQRTKKKVNEYLWK